MGSSPISATRARPVRVSLIKRPRGQEVKTPPFHGSNTGSIPVGVTKTKKKDTIRCPFFVAQEERILTSFRVVRNTNGVRMQVESRCQLASIRLDAALFARKKPPSFYPSRRLGISSRFSVYIIAVCVYHHRRCILCDLMIYNTLCW